MKMINNLKGAAPPKVITDLRHLVNSGADSFGKKALYIYKDDRTGEFTEYSYIRLRDEVNYIGTALTKLGISDKNIAVSGDTHPRYIATYIATVAGNGCIIPIDKELSAEATVGFLRLSEASAFVYTKAQNEKAGEIYKAMPELIYIAIEPDDDYKFAENVYTMDEIAESGKSEMDAGNLEFTERELEMNKMSALLFTSGTTGTSKGVMLSHKNLAAATNASVLSMSYDDRNTFVSVLPPHHSYEITCGHLAIMDLGAQIFINDGLKNVLKNFRSYSPNALMLVPLFVETMHKKIWDEVRKKGLEKQFKAIIKMNGALLAVRLDLRNKIFKQVTSAFGGNLKSIVCGGAPLSPQLIKDFYAFGVTVLEGYGITECAPLVAVNSPGKVKFRSVGLPVAGCKVKIDLKEGEETGEILVKGDNVMIGYYKNPEATAAAFTEDGWFRTGDIGYMDADGYIFITGRLKNVIILSNGKNVFPEEIEEYLSAVPLILESVVLARKNDAGEQLICAIVVPNDELIAEKTKEEVYAEIKAAVSEINHKLPAFKQIRKIEVRCEKFERTTSKKIQRFKVN